MSATSVVSFRFPPPVRVGLHDGELCWWVDEFPVRLASNGLPRINGRVYRTENGYAADSPCFLVCNQTRSHESPVGAAVAAWLRETAMAPVVEAIVRDFAGRAVLFVADGNRPNFAWPWRPDPTVRPEGLAAWEARAVAAAAVYRRFSFILTDNDAHYAWIIEAVAGGVGIVRMAIAAGGDSTRWLAERGVKRLLLKSGSSSS